MNQQHILHLASLLHDIGKFRRRGNDNNTTHQEHSYQFITEDFTDFFSECDDILKDAIRHHHNPPEQLQHLIKKQVILADRLSATEDKNEGSETESLDETLLVSPLSTLKGAKQINSYSPTVLNLQNRDTIIPSDSASFNQDTYTNLWEDFKKAFTKVTTGERYTPEHYQTVVALLHKYTSRIPSTQVGEESEQDISLYDHLRTTAAIAACIGIDLTDESAVDAQFGKETDTQINLCSLIKGDISGIQNFLYNIVSDGASNQLRGRSFYLQLLTEAIAQWVLRKFDLPITNLLLASGGHFYILAPHSIAQNGLDEIRKTVSQKLWELHRGDISCMLASVPINAQDFEKKNFSDKWREVSDLVNEMKRKKWSEMEAGEMFSNLFEPHENIDEDMGFVELGRQIRDAQYLVTFEVPEQTNIEKPNHNDAIRAFGIEFHLAQDVQDVPQKPENAQKGVVYRLTDTDFVNDDIFNNFKWDDCRVSYDFRISHPVIAHRHDGQTADYDYLANASDGVQWFGALRLDVDNLGTVFTEKLQNATISRLATLSEAMRLFFEGYVPQLCRDYNNTNDKEILELIYAGGDDLFLVGGWSALPIIARHIREEFHHFVTGDHVTLSGGIAIEHKKFPLYQFALQSGNAEDAAKNIDDNKDAITFLRKPMKWEDFDVVKNWHQMFLDAMLTNKSPLPSAVLTRLNQIYADKRRWAWRSIYYFSDLQYRYSDQRQFIQDLKSELNHEKSFPLRDYIDVITRWTALQVRKMED